jgi:DNA polymerase-3 subunit gamma/tau
MKRCPKCQAEYPDDANWCRFDGGKLQLVAAAPAPAPQPSTPQLPQKPGALTMGWDAVPDVSAAQTNPSMLAPDPKAPKSAPASAQPAQQSGPRAPQKPGALTMGWDAMPEPVAPAQPSSSPQAQQIPGPLTMGWDVPEVPAQQETVTPASLAEKAVATSHAPAARSPAAKVSPAATLIGMQAPWLAEAQQHGAPAAQPHVAASAQPAPIAGATQAYSAQQPPFVQSTSPTQQPSIGGSTQAYNAQQPSFAQSASVAQPSAFAQDASAAQQPPFAQNTSPAASTTAQLPPSYAPPQMPAPHVPPGFEPPNPAQYAPPQMPPAQVSPAQLAQQPGSPYAPHAAPQPAYDPNPTLKTRSTPDDALDKPPKNMLPIYALIGVVLIAGLFAAIFFATR